MQSVYQWEKTVDDPGISRYFATIPLIFVPIPPACVGDIPPKPGAFSGRVVIEILSSRTI
jgi:hypothetical protein